MYDRKEEGRREGGMPRKLCTVASAKKKSRRPDPDPKKRGGRGRKGNNNASIERKEAEQLFFSFLKMFL